MDKQIRTLAQEIGRTVASINVATDTETLTLIKVTNLSMGIAEWMKLITKQVQEIENRQFVIMGWMTPKEAKIK